MADPIEGFMRAWAKHENAPRTTCPECHFESSEGYPLSHAPGCSTALSQSPTCPDCGSDPRERDIHREGCRRVFPDGDPREDLQFGPPWQPWREATYVFVEADPNGV